MGLLEKMTADKFKADKERADKIAKSLAKEKAQDAKDKKGK